MCLRIWMGFQIHSIGEGNRLSQGLSFSIFLFLVRSGKSAVYWDSLRDASPTSVAQLKLGVESESSDDVFSLLRGLQVHQATEDRDAKTTAAVRAYFIFLLVI
jgi:hypothetical protein